jgi:hypothetical protein
VRVDALADLGGLEQLREAAGQRELATVILRLGTGELEPIEAAHEAQLAGLGIPARRERACGGHGQGAPWLFVDAVERDGQTTEAVRPAGLWATNWGQRGRPRGRERAQAQGCPCVHLLVGTCERLLFADQRGQQAAGGPLGQQRVDEIDAQLDAQILVGCERIDRRCGAGEQRAGYAEIEAWPFASRRRLNPQPGRQPERTHAGLLAEAQRHA